jgi:hypothetical protein
MLSANLRLVTMLRYFTGVTAYEHIAQLCAVPVGTVRSRLSQARLKLSAALSATAGLAHDDAATLTAARRRDAEETLQAAHRGSFAEIVTPFPPWCGRPEVVSPTAHRMRRRGLLRRCEQFADGIELSGAPLHLVAARSRINEVPA